MTQLSLFDAPSPYQVPRTAALTLDADALMRWKQRVHDYQQALRYQSAPQQQTLFETSPSSWHQPEEIDPFTLAPHSALFWRQTPQDTVNAQQGCLYFILDRQLPLLLYVGETKLTANQRWRGTHDCKTYLFRYVELHRRYGQSVAVVSAFWHHLPNQKKVLQRWERDLILKWRPPFNKECWQWWGQPFGKKL